MTGYSRYFYLIENTNGANCTIRVVSKTVENPGMGTTQVVEDGATGTFTVDGIGQNGSAVFNREDLQSCDRGGDLSGAIYSVLYAHRKKPTKKLV